MWIESFFCLKMFPFQKIMFNCNSSIEYFCIDPPNILAMSARHTFSALVRIYATNTFICKHFVRCEGCAGAVSVYTHEICEADALIWTHTHSNVLKLIFKYLFNFCTLSAIYYIWATSRRLPFTNVFIKYIKLI